MTLRSLHALKGRSRFPPAQFPVSRHTTSDHVPGMMMSKVSLIGHNDQLAPQVASTVPVSLKIPKKSAWSSLMSKITKRPNETQESSQTSKKSRSGLHLKSSPTEAKFEELPGDTKQLEAKSLNGLMQIGSHPSITQGPDDRAPQQIGDVVSTFTVVVSKHLKLSPEYASMPNFAQHHLLEDLQDMLQTFCEAFHLDRHPSHVQSIKMISRLRREIAHRILDEAIHPTTAIRSMNPEVKPSSLLHGQYVSSAGEASQSGHLSKSLDPPPASSQTPDAPQNMPWLWTSRGPNFIKTEIEESEDHIISRLVTEDNVNASEILEDITRRQAFQKLIRAIEQALEQYSCQKMDLIRRYTSSRLRLRGGGLSPGKEQYRVKFHLDWNLPAFLESNYDGGLDQGIRMITAVTGTRDSAILCSVGEYFAKQWPTLPVTLLAAISSARGRAPAVKRHQRGPGKLRSFSSQYLPVTRASTIALNQDDFERLHYNDWDLF